MVLGGRMALMIGVMLTGSASAGAKAQDMPRLERHGGATQLVVDGSPYLILGGELHNSSASSAEYMGPVWDKLAKNDVRTVIGTASWDLIEPSEGRYDFTTVDEQIRQARVHGIRLVMIWFGAYKNAESTYAPSWVRRDERRFPRSVKSPTAKPRGMGAFLRGPTLSVFNPRLVEADARAYAALMAHLRQVDGARTVIMMQVENEVGLLGDSRDRGALADAAWRQSVPAALIRYLRAHRATLRPWVVDLWKRNGMRDTGAWADVFGTDAAAEELFMAWHFSRYVDQVAVAGAKAYPLPMYTNAWLGPQSNAPDPGGYPSGGPVSRMMDVWKAGAPSIALLAPDIYVDDFAGTLNDYKRDDNPILVPEAKFDAGNLFVAIGKYAALGFSPFGIEDGADGNETFQAYRLLNEMPRTLTKAQADGTIRGFKIASGAQQRETLGGYDITVSGPRSTAGVFGPGTGADAATTVSGYGLVFQTGPDQFTVVGRGISVAFKHKDGEVEVDAAQEGRFVKDVWEPGRALNGDERFSLFPSTEVRAVRITVLRRPA